MKESSEHHPLCDCKDCEKTHPRHPAGGHVYLSAPFRRYTDSELLYFWQNQMPVPPNPHAWRKEFKRKN